MAYPSVWSTRDMRAFLIGDGYPVFLSMTMVHSVDITSLSGANWRCSMCGTPNNSVNKCTGCNAPRKEMLTRGIAFIEGYLPGSLILNELDRGFQMDILYRGCNRPDEYCEENIAVSLQDCRVLRKWIPSLGVVNHEENEPVVLCLEVGCEVKLMSGEWQ